MADLHVINSLNLSSAVKFNTSFRYIITKGDDDGDHKWVLEVGTTHSGIDGSTFLSTKVHYTDSDDFDEVMEKALSSLCAKIDWGILVEDNKAPIITNYYPSGDSIPIGSYMSIDIEDLLPSAGIDLSNMNVTFNNGEVDFDITNEIEINGDPYRYNLKWVPPKKNNLET